MAFFSAGNLVVEDFFLIVNDGIQDQLLLGAKLVSESRYRSFPSSLQMNLGHITAVHNVSIRGREHPALPAAFTLNLQRDGISLTVG